jgi:hypothetical protein
MWIVGQDGYVATSNDDGVHWQRIENIPLSNNLESVAIPDSTSVILVGNAGAALSSDDEGKTWTRLILPDLAARGLHDLFFVDDKRGWIAGDDGLIFWTGDGGTTWKKLNEAAGLNIKAIRVQSNELGWAAAEVPGGKQPVLLHATEGTQPGAWHVLPHYIAPWWYAALVFGFVPLTLIKLRLYAARDPAVIDSRVTSSLSFFEVLALLEMVGRPPLGEPIKLASCVWE